MHPLVLIPAPPDLPTGATAGRCYPATLGTRVRTRTNRMGPAPAGSATIIDFSGGNQ